MEAEGEMGWGAGGTDEVENFFGFELRSRVEVVRGGRRTKQWEHGRVSVGTFISTHLLPLRVLEGFMKCWGMSKRCSVWSSPCEINVKSLFLVFGVYINWQHRHFRSSKTGDRVSLLIIFVIPPHICVSEVAITSIYSASAMADLSKFSGI